MRQTIACLPEGWRDHYALVSTNPSDPRRPQIATPDNPRVILSPPINFREPSEGRAIAFMLNGSGTLEIMDQSNEQSRFSDVSFTEDEIREGSSQRRRAHAELSSERCTTCHSSPSGSSYTPVFSFAPIWPNTFPKFYKPTVCITPSERADTEREQRRLITAAEASSSLASLLPGFVRTLQVTAEEPLADFYERTVDRDPTCADRTAPIGSYVTMSPEKEAGALANFRNFDANRLGLMIENFEMAMIETSHEAVAQEIVEKFSENSQVAKYKFALVGAMVGCFNSSSPQAEAWFPTSELRRQAELAQAMPPSAQSGQQLSQWLGYLSQAGAVDSSSLLSNLTCSGTVENYQDHCFPASCDTANRMVRNLQETLNAARTAAELGNPTSVVNSRILRSIAHSNWELRRNWLPLGCGNRNNDADTWGVVRYLNTVMPEEFSLDNYWAQHFTEIDGRTYSQRYNQRMVDTLARRIIKADQSSPMLDSENIIGDTSTSPCERLQRASMQAFRPAPAP